jgi:hypothetical protein
MPGMVANKDSHTPMVIKTFLHGMTKERHEKVHLYINGQMLKSKMILYFV